jgi:formate-dependent nitrite reductase membrane component NrfD
MRGRSMEEKVKNHFVFGWKVIAYLFLAGVGGGASIVATAFQLIHPEAEIILRAGVILGAPLVLFGSLLLFFDLGRPAVAFRAFSRPHKAWISRGTFVLTTFIILGAIQFGTWIWPFHGLKDYPSLHHLLNILYGIFGILTVVYTGFLFDTTRSIPFWSTPILPLLFLVSGISTGMFALMILLLISESSGTQWIGPLGHLDAFILIFEGMVLFFYLHGMHEVTAARASVRRLLKGDLSTAFWVGVILIGLVIPFVLEVFLGRGSLSILIASLCGLVGGLYVRYVVVSGAVKAPLNAEGVLIYLSPRPE